MISTFVAVEKMGIRVGWINNVIMEINARGDHVELLQEARLLRIQLEELHEQMDKVGQRFVELDTRMLHKNFSSHSIENHKIQIVKENE